MATPEHVAIQQERAMARQAEAVEAINAKLHTLMARLPPPDVAGAELSMPGVADLSAKLDDLFRHQAQLAAKLEEMAAARLAEVKDFIATHQELVSAVETIGGEVAALAQSRSKGR